MPSYDTPGMTLMLRSGTFCTAYTWLIGQKRNRLTTPSAGCFFCPYDAYALSVARSPHPPPPHTLFFLQVGILTSRQWLSGKTGRPCSLSFFRGSAAWRSRTSPGKLSRYSYIDACMHDGCSLALWNLGRRCCVTVTLDDNSEHDHYQI